jgi:hypothetical protein
VQLLQELALPPELRVVAAAEVVAAVDLRLPGMQHLLAAAAAAVASVGLLVVCRHLAPRLHPVFPPEQDQHWVWQAAVQPLASQ